MAKNHPDESKTIGFPEPGAGQRRLQTQDQRGQGQDQQDQGQSQAQTKGHDLPSLVALKTFEAVGRHLSFKAAAEELCVTPAAVSRQVKLLEESLKTTLLVRNNRSTYLTDTGSEYLHTVNQCLSELSRATRDLFPQRRGQLAKASLKIGVGPAFASYWLSRRIGNFRDLYPQLSLEIHLTQAQDEGFSEHSLERLDVVIYTGERLFPGLHQERLFRLVDYPVCSPRLIRPRIAPLAASSLGEFTLIHEGSPHWWPRWFKHVGVKFETGSKLSQGPLIHDEALSITLAVAGEGIALGDDISAAPYLESGELIRPVRESMVTDEWVCVLKHKKQSPNPHAELFSRWLREEMKTFSRSLANAEP